MQQTAYDTGGQLDDSATAAVRRRYLIRNMSADQFIALHSSGTLRKNKALGMRWRDQYLAERTAYEFGFGFECAQRSRIMQGEAYTGGDCHAITEAGWHMERYITLSIFPADEYLVRYIQLEESDGTRREGIGLVVAKTDASFIPPSHMAFAIISEYDPKAKAWREPRNPF